MQESLQLLLLPLMFVAMYFLLIRPQRKRQQAHDAMLRELRDGDDVVTVGGLHGTVIDIRDDGAVDLEVTDDVVLRYERSAIQRVLRDESVDEVE